MAIVLIIMGLVSGFTFPIIKIMMDGQKAQTTALHQEQILYALASYANKNNFLPYAANPTLQTGDQDASSRLRRGIVPFKNLGLPESIAKDGYHHWFTYVIDDFYGVQPERATAQSIFEPLKNRLCKNRHFSAGQTPLKIRNVPEKIAVALISHGPEGRGSYPHHSSLLPQGIDEQQNSTSDQEIIDQPLRQDPTNPFSHKVAWVTAKNLMAIYARSPCPPLNDALPQSKDPIFQIPREERREDNK
jgi:hypothetical protein